MKKQHASPAGHWTWGAHSPHSHAVRCGEVIWVSGQMALAANGQPAGGDAIAQLSGAVASLAKVLGEFDYAHPIFDPAAMGAQREMWSIQGVQHTWFCGAYMGSGFHEDGIQAGLAVAERLGCLKRPWSVTNESGRIHLGPQDPQSPAIQIAAE